MIRTGPNYKPGFYAGEKPYRDCLVAALKHFGMTDFTAYSEFWTLGGKEWYEYKFLLEQGLTFGEGSYHNVDYGTIDPLDDPAVVRHKSNFLDIWEIWEYPTVLCFDSTNGLVDSKQVIWMDFVQMGIAAAKISGVASLNWNFLAGYGHILYDRIGEKGSTQRQDNPDELFDRYEKWLRILASHADFAGFSTEFFDCSVMAPKEGSPTPMISGHCLLSDKSQ